jgi:5-methylcytosine-specific restriction endonuclease McrA
MLTKTNEIQEPTTYQKAHIPKALREQVWIQYYGTVFHNKCPTCWCQNRVNVFDFQVGHNVPESKGGSTTIDNLIPICGRCNLSMSNTYTFDEWSATFGSRRRTWVQFFCCCLRPKKE